MSSLINEIYSTEYGEVGFQQSNIHISGASDTSSKQLIPVSRDFGATGKAIIQWSVRQSEIASKYIRGPMKGEVTFFSGSQESSIPLQLASDWADNCTEPEEVYIDLVSIKQGAYLKKEKLTCILSFVPGKSRVIHHCPVSPSHNIIIYIISNLYDVAYTSYMTYHLYS